MKLKHFFLSLFALGLASCASDADKANNLLKESRQALSEKQYERARTLIDSLRSTFPKALDVRKEALAVYDSIDYLQAKSEIVIIDSILSFKTLDLKEMAKQFVFEKDEKYQTVGNFVVPEYAGSKQNLTFFAQVSEDGVMKIVSIDKDRKYHMTEVAVSGTRGTEAYLPKDATAKDVEAVNKCYAFALLFGEVKNLQETAKKLDTKVRFYEAKFARGGTK